jgi:hypothetical protein
MIKATSAPVLEVLYLEFLVILVRGKTNYYLLFIMKNDLVYIIGNT